jgi:lipid-A-disaccharide synthase
VGHPLIERLDELRPSAGERTPLGSGPIRLLVLPGSRRSEVGRLMGPFGETLGLLQDRLGQPLEVTLPAVPHLVEEIGRASAAWPVRPNVVQGEGAKFAAFRAAHAALAASGTVTLELGLAQVPMVVAYRVSKIEEVLQYLIKAHSIVLTNLVLGENIVPELIQWDCTPQKLADAVAGILVEGPDRQRQLAAFERLDALMRVGEETPSERAARIVLEVVASRT